MSVGALYFGCKNGEKGHYAFNKNMTTFGIRNSRMAQILAHTEGLLCIPDAAQPEGQALVHHINGWTVLAFWDRSVDGRFSSNSAFAFPCECTGEEAIEHAKREFPAIWERFTFPVQVVSRFVE